MIASPSSSKSPASYQTVLQALEEHLEPTPLLSTLPSALNLFAHLQLVSRQITRQAAKALNYHQDTLVKHKGDNERRPETIAALSEVDMKRLGKMKARDEGDVMFGLSLELRRRVSRPRFD